jgi:hypothetical protein
MYVWNFSLVKKGEVQNLLEEKDLTFSISDIPVVTLIGRIPGTGVFASALAGAIDDIETALDSIIAIQESLMGGAAQLIRFTIAGTEYQATEGMTWAQWIESEYNTGGFFMVSETENVYYVKSPDSGLVIDVTYVSADTRIIANRQYTLEE